MEKVAEDMSGLCTKKRQAARQKEGTLGGASQEELAGLWDAYTTSGAEGYLRWKLDYHEERARRGEYVLASTLVHDLAHLGEKDQAFEWLEKAYEQRDGNLMYLKESPFSIPSAPTLASQTCFSG